MTDQERAWEAYVESELPVIRRLLSLHHITLAAEQPHLKGERFLIQALTTVGGRKLILLGTNATTQQKVVIKATREAAGKAELLHERTCRSLLHAMKFSYESFHSPQEVLFAEVEGYTLYVGEFIEQTSSFLERPLEEQFNFALRALKAQEQTRATTATHLGTVRNVFGTKTSDDYRTMTDDFLTHISKHPTLSEASALVTKVAAVLRQNLNRVDQYCGFLTHTDFVPHNFRIRDNVLYLLDFSSLRFGNKHEGWARFLNFMTLYNPALETLLLTYVRENRSPEEVESLHLMRLFRLAEIIAYYSETLDRSSGNVHALNRARIDYWSAVLDAELHHTSVSAEITEAYKAQRDALRSDGEKERQVGLH